MYQICLIEVKNLVLKEELVKIWLSKVNIYPNLDVFNSKI